MDYFICLELNVLKLGPVNSGRFHEVNGETSVFDSLYTQVRFRDAAIAGWATPLPIFRFKIIVLSKLVPSFSDLL